MTTTHRLARGAFGLDRRFDRRDESGWGGRSQQRGKRYGDSARPRRTRRCRLGSGQGARSSSAGDTMHSWGTRGGGAGLTLGAARRRHRDVGRRVDGWQAVRAAGAWSRRGARAPLLWEQVGGQDSARATESEDGARTTSRPGPPRPDRLRRFTRFGGPRGKPLARAPVATAPRRRASGPAASVRAEASRRPDRDGPRAVEAGGRR